MEIAAILVVVSSLMGVIGSLYFGVNTLFKRIWMIQTYLATIKEATIYQSKKLDEMSDFDASVSNQTQKNTQSIADIERYLELYSRGQQHPYIIRGKHYEDS